MELSILELLDYCNISLMIDNETVEEATEFLEALKCDSSLELMNIYNRLHSVMEILPAPFLEMCEILKNITTLTSLSHHYWSFQVNEMRSIGCLRELKCLTLSRGDVKFEGFPVLVELLECSTTINSFPLPS
jgi:hypothetical protein